MYVTTILKFLTCFSTIKMNYNKYDFITHTIMLHQDLNCINCKVVAISCMPLNSKLWLYHIKNHCQEH